VRAAPAHLFAPLPAVRWRYAGASDYGKTGAGKNPPRGAILSYHLAAKPEGEVVIEVLDAKGRQVRRLSSVPRAPYSPPDHPDRSPESEVKADLEVEPGMNRASWDLTCEGARWIPGSRTDVGDPRRGFPVPPGDYTLRLTVEGRSHERPLRVVPDPRSRATAAELEAQFAFNLEIRDRMTRIAGMAETIRGLRAALSARVAELRSNSGAAELVALGERILPGLDAVEGAIHNPKAEVGYDILAGRDGGAKLYSRLGWLLAVARDHDGPPTQGMQEVGADLAGELAAQEAALDALLSGDLAKLNALAAERGIPFVAVP
jgi:hypothetical protein